VTGVQTCALPICGDAAAALDLARKARANAEFFENYPELALLHFQLTWERGAPLARSPWRNPDRPPPQDGFWSRLRASAGSVVDRLTGRGEEAFVQ
jgi:hypothetical protein